MSLISTIIAYVTRCDDDRVVVTFCAAKSESSLHLILKSAAANQVWDHFVKSSTATFGKVGWAEINIKLNLS